MQISRLLLLSPALLASAQITSLFNSIASDVTSAGEDVTSFGGSVYTVVTNNAGSVISTVTSGADSLGTKITSVGGSVVTEVTNAAGSVVSTVTSDAQDATHNAGAIQTAAPFFGAGVLGAGMAVAAML